MFFDRKMFFATLILIGTVIGAGIFALPYVISKSGLIPGIFYFIFLGFIVLLLHFCYGEIVLRTQARCRIVGFAEKYLGQRGKYIVLISVLVGLTGSILVYLILGSTFLQLIFPSHLPKILYVLFFWLFISGLIISDWGKAAIFNSLMTGALIIVVLVIVFYGLRFVKFSNIPLINWSYLFIPWGPIFYSLSGGSAIPEMREVMEEKSKNLKKAIIIGSLIPVLIYFLFSFVVIGVVGASITTESIAGLGLFLGKTILYLGGIFGFLNIATSYLVLGMVLKKILIYDLKVAKAGAVGFTCLVPPLLYLIGFYNFIQIISFLGLWLGAVDGILLLIIHRQAQLKGDRQPEYSLKLSKLNYIFISFVFIIALVFGLTQF